MINLLMFIISFIAVITSSYFICSLLKSKKFEKNVIFYILIVISQIIATFEILSIIKQVNVTGVLTVNFVVWIITFGVWTYLKRPVLKIPDIKNSKNKIIQALKQDKILKVLCWFFIFSSLVSLFLTLVAPTNIGDCLGYHLARIGFWIQQVSLNHYETSSIRQLVFPINSEILILWSMVFFKRDYLAQMPEYLSYIGCLFVLFNLMSYQKISTRRILWTLFILASLPSIILESSSCQTNLIMSFLLLSSLYLFMVGVKENDNKSLIFSAVSYGIALGTKNTAFLFIPAIGIIYLLFSLKELKRNFYKPLLIFVLSLVPVFIILSSYNYVLNYIDFGNPFSPQSFMHQHSPGFTIKGFFVNIIKYFIMFFDFSGITNAQVLNPFFMGIKDHLFHLFSLKTEDGLAFTDLSNINTFIQENYSMFGILGFILFLPLVFKTSITKIKFSNNKSFIAGLAGLTFIVFLITISAAMGYCMWFNRFFVTAIVLSAPVFIFSYTRRTTIWKIFITLIAIINFLVISTCNMSKPFFPIVLTLRNHNISQFRSEIRLRADRDVKKRMLIYDIVRYTGKIAPNNSKIAIIFAKEECVYPFFEENPTWKIFSLRYDLLYKRKNYNDYDFIIIPDKEQRINIPFKGKIKYNYKLVNKKIIYDKQDNNEPVIIYNNINVLPIDAGLPATMSTLINLQDIPSNFKLLRKYIMVDFDIKPYTYHYYIYKKVR